MNSIIKKLAAILLIAFLFFSGPYFLDLALDTGKVRVINAVYPPTTPSLIFPADNTTVSGITIDFQWNASSNATQYQLQVLEVDDTIFIDEELGNITNYTIDGFPDDGTHFKWRARAGNDTVWSEWSDVITFTNGSDETKIDFVVLDVDETKVKLKLDDYATAFFESEGNQLFDYLKGERDTPFIHAICSGDKFICIYEYAENFFIYSDVSDAIENSDSVPDAEVEEFWRFIEFDDDGNAVLEKL